MAIDNSKFGVHAALMARLKTIGGSGFWNQLQNRVYPRLIIPGDERIQETYLCLPLVEEAQRYEITETFVKTWWNLTIFGFVQETASSRVECDSLSSLCHLHDDILRALMHDWTLGGAAVDTTILGTASWAGEEDADAPYGELQMALEIHQQFSRESLALSWQ